MTLTCILNSYYLDPAGPSQGHDEG